MEYLNSFGDEIKFDENGDPAAMYDLVNWQLRSDGEMEFVTIGKFDESSTAVNQKLQIQEQNIIWNGNRTKVGILTGIKHVFIFLVPDLYSFYFLFFSLDSLISMQQHLSARYPEGNQTQFSYLLP